jgi:hypothetical protein
VTTAANRESYQRLFHQTIEKLADLSDALGLSEDDKLSGGTDHMLAKIAELRALETSKAGATADRAQVGGTHYKDMGVQPWHALASWMTDDQFQAYLLGTAIAYLARVNSSAPGKGGRQDVEKAVHTLQKLLEVMK